MIICSPHCDDAALSLGAASASGALGKVKTAVFFSRSRFTRREPGTGDERKVTALRADEERRAAAVCGYKPSFLNLPEPFARPGYSLKTLRDMEIDPCGDPVFAAALAAALNLALAGEPMLFPAGVGGHIDHRILAIIGKGLCGRAPVAGFYEDIPYTALWGREKTDAFIEEEYGGMVTRRLHFPSDGCRAVKRNALRCYASQLAPSEVSGLLKKSETCGGEAVWLTEAGERFFSGHPPTSKKTPRRKAGA